ncbi:hypothetical protein HMPREF0044_1503 [Gleimia coleocanis DSM 15436]|uniref:DUF4235 domain-containing protein n=1 Tax=Gleimia coleocanis DSM 15436 TaxID=525245 RepID=C0W250_9ACTO|nr:DUF4235 domain-containing protein [Gleimia coleocanis]EEH63264.1 hypothetical protein HMPREF0044_1503 [Gleimia coleocanis DSM 15436]
MDITSKLITAGAVAAAGFVADKIVDKGWVMVTGRPAPSKEEEDTAALVEVLVFAAISGAVVALTRRYALRGTNKFIAKREARALQA